MNMTFMFFSFLSFLCLPEGILLAGSVRAKSLQSCPILGDPMDYSTPDAYVHGTSTRQEYWSGLPFPSPCLQAGSLLIVFENYWVPRT